MTSRIFNFGSYGSVPVNPTKENMQSYVTSGELEKLKSAVRNSGMTYNDVIDQYGNTLLHLATTSKQYHIIEFLLTTTVQLNRENIFRQTANDIAIFIQDKRTLQLFSEAQHSELRKEVQNLRYESGRINSLVTDNVSLKSLNASLRDSNDILSRKVTTLTGENKNLTTENSELRRKVANTVNYDIYSKENASLRSEVTVLNCNNKRLREEVTELTNQNSKLKLSVDSLIKSRKT